MFISILQMRPREVKLHVERRSSKAHLKSPVFAKHDVFDKGELEGWKLLWEDGYQLRLKE